MIYIFEDKRSAALTQLLLAGYDIKQRNEFIYTNGNTNLARRARKELDRNPAETVVIFMDVVPDNMDTLDIYSDLNNMRITEYGSRLIIVPIPCAEYYFIKSVKNTNIVVKQKSVDICSSRGFYKADPEIKSDIDRQRCRSFETYCKFIRERALKHCVRSKVTGKKNTYLIQACPCEHPDDDCIHKSLEEKCYELLKQYPMVPAGSILEYPRRILSENDIQIKIDILKKEYNDMVDMLLANGVGTREDYIYI